MSGAITIEGQNYPHGNILVSMATVSSQPRMPRIRTRRHLRRAYWPL